MADSSRDLQAVGNKAKFSIMLADSFILVSR